MDDLSWDEGDVIGLCLDLEQGTFHVSQNGEPMLKLFHLDVGSAAGFFPTLSMNSGLVRAKFGAHTAMRDIERHWAREGYDRLSSIPAAHEPTAFNTATDI